MQNTGIHHISVLSSDARKAYAFYHHVLGLKLIIKTVNQDDPYMYHLFFGDETGRQGTEFTVFQMATKPNQFGSNAIERTLFLVPSYESLLFWRERLEAHEVCHYDLERFGEATMLRFEDDDAQPLGLVYHEGLDLSKFSPYVHPGIPAEHAILGLGGVQLRVRYAKATARVLTEYFDFQPVATFEAYGHPVTVFRHEANDFGHEVHVIEDKTSPIQRLGVGGIHHVAFGVEAKSDLEELELELENQNIINSGIKNRDFMWSSYFREPNYNLFEVATPITKERETFPEPGADFEAIPLFLPDFLAHRRDEIEAHLD